MLVLTRKAGESIEIGNGIRVTVLSANGNRIRLGIEAPGDTVIRRSELSWEDEPVADPKKSAEKAGARATRRPGQQPLAVAVPSFTVHCAPSLS